MVREVGGLSRRAARQDKRLATLAIDTEIAFASAERRAAFADELTAAVTDLAARFHEPGADGARPHRLVVGAHPIPETRGRRPRPTTTAPSRPRSRSPAPPRRYGTRSPPDRA